MSNALTRDVTDTTDDWTSIINQLQSILALGQCGFLTIDGQRLLIHGGEQRYLDESGVLVGWKTASVNQVPLITSFERLMPVSNDMIRASQSGRPLDELLWTCAWHQFGDKWSDRCRRDDVVSFHRWPNLSRLPHTASTHRIVALLTQRPSSIVLAARLLKVSEADVARVYCAGQKAGYAEPINRKVEAPAPRRHRHQSLLTRLMSRLQGSR